MFAKAIPSLLETVEDTGAIKEVIEKGCMTSGRVIAAEDDFGKGMSFIIQLTDVRDPAEACLKDTHGEQFHSDADKEVVDYLTTVEKIDLVNSPVHNPYVVPGPQSGFPKTQKSDGEDDIEKAGAGAGSRGGDVVGTGKSGKPIYAHSIDYKEVNRIKTAKEGPSIDYSKMPPPPDKVPNWKKKMLNKGDSVFDALDVIEKGFPLPPKKPRMSLKKPPKGPLQAKQERRQRKEAGLAKGGGEGARGVQTSGGKFKIDKSFNREELMAKAMGWNK